MDKKEKRIFIIRIIVWSIFSALLPVIFIGWRYSLFKKVGNIQLSGWGLLAIVILFFFVRAFIKYVKAGFVEYSMTKQVLNGVLKIIMPLCVLLIICVAIRNNIDYFIQALCITIVSETIAIPINPFPQWVYNKSQGRIDSMLDLFSSKLNKKEENK